MDFQADVYTTAEFILIMSAALLAEAKMNAFSDWTDELDVFVRDCGPAVLAEVKEFIK